MKRTIILVCLIYFGTLVSFSQSESEPLNNSDSVGLKQGRWIHYYNNYDPPYFDVGIYLNDVKEGVWRSFYLDSTLKQDVEFVNGIKNGTFRTYRKDGRIHGRGKYVNGKLDSIFLGYDTLGHLISKLTWEKGELVDYEYYNPNAKPTGTLELVGGKQFVWVNGELIQIKKLTTIR